MEKIQLISILQQYGMTENEAKIYLTLIEYHGCIASSVARITSINRATTYTVLHEMKKKGWVRSLTKNEVTSFYAVDSKTLFQEIEKQYLQFKEALPVLDTLATQYNHQKAKLEYYDGEEGIKKVFEMTLQSKTPLYAILSDQTYNKKLKYRLEHDYLPQRIKKKIPAYCIANFCDENNSYKEKDTKYLRETKIINNSDFSIYGEICIFDENKVIHIYADKETYYGVVHISESYYNTMLSIFKHLWSHTTPS